MVNNWFNNALRNLFRTTPSVKYEPIDGIVAEGQRLEDAGQIQEAMTFYLNALEKFPGSAGILVRIGLLAGRMGKHGDAIQYLERAVELSPDWDSGHLALGNALFERHEYGAAVPEYRQAVTMMPNSGAAHCNLGLAYRALGELNLAADHLHRSLELKPGNRKVILNLGLVLQDLGRHDNAKQCFQSMLALDPQDKEARLYLAILRLASGDYAKGWPDYEFRLKGYIDHPGTFPFPRWNGERVPAKTVLIYGEQGIGDQIMFASCIREAMTQASRCVIYCDRKLERLFDRSFPGATVLAGKRGVNASDIPNLPAIDFAIPMGSLPGIFRTNAASFPQHSGYLRAAPERIEHWSARLRDLGNGLKVGISWRGGLKQTRCSLRSISLESWLPLLRITNVQFVSLQYTDCSSEIDTLREQHGIDLPQWPEAIRDYDETAALVSALDLVISVQTSVIHLAGSLGRPVWVMVPAAPEWRYQTQGETMPWYPSARLFRQQELNNWKPVVGKIAQELESLANRSGIATASLTTASQG